MEVQVKVKAHLQRLEEDARQFWLRFEFEALEDPVRKRVIESVGGKVDWVNSEYTSTTWSCIKKVNCSSEIEWIWRSNVWSLFYNSSAEIAQKVMSNQEVAAKHMPRRLVLRKSDDDISCIVVWFQ
ncbi:hypothetical protein DCAR_0205304 [Daucus carota subsp. sativus]|uniref:Uncharacterized protein n=1 Tax=Daucus carota subsp. sativus TaxID=79200 RepID=A0A175YAY7_DAUCS|nr:hypothetical protein DCAR_0205304 [Daucus carota subsp. sativus]